MAYFKTATTAKGVSLFRDEPDGEGRLLVITTRQRNEHPLGSLGEQILGNVLSYADKYIGPWCRVDVVCAEPRIVQQVKAYRASAVLLVGKGLTGPLAKLGELKQEGNDAYGLLVERGGIRWIATPPMGVYGASDDANWRQASCLGWLYSHIELLARGLPGKDRGDVVTKLVETREDFLAMRSAILRSRWIAIDTEGRDLQRIKAQLLTVQFCADGRIGYVLPIAHEESQVEPGLLRQVMNWLKWYFESGPQSTHVYAHGKYDLHQFISSLGIRWYNHDAYDLALAEFCLDENRGLRRKAIGGDVGFSLERISLEYGYRDYDDSRISKKDRARMYAMPLADVADYGAIDVVRPWHIARQQVALARWRDESRDHKPYRHFYKTVTRVCGRQLQQFVFMERNGLLVDKKYLTSVMGVNSPFRQQVEVARSEFERLPEVQQANELLLAKRGVGGRTLFNTQRAWAFDANKPDHKQTLFFDVCKLEPLARNKAGGGKVDKKFQDKYRNHPVIAAFKRISELEKLQGTFIVGFHKFLTTMPDNSDGRLRTTYKAVGSGEGKSDDAILTGRSASQDPNLQNIPTRTKAAKQIKRQFVSKKGRLFVKRDFSAHEVRGWGATAGDPKIALTFWNGMQTRLKYIAQDAIPKDRVDWWSMQVKVSDVHYQNYALVYNVSPTVVTDEQRSDFKPVIFGAVYGKSVGTLGKDFELNTLKRDEDAVRKIQLDFKKETDAKKRRELRDAYRKAVEVRDADRAKDWGAYARKVHTLVFKKTFKVGGDWIEQLQRNASVTMHATSLVGRVRHLWGYLHPERRIQGDMDRRGPNSAVQGMGSDLGYVGGYFVRKLVWEFFISQGYDFDYVQCNAVHDSTEAETAFEIIPIVEYLSHHGFTTCVHRWMRGTFGVTLNVGLEMDAEIGACLAELKKAKRWEQVVDATAKGIAWGNENLGWNYSPEEVAAIMRRVEHNAKIIHAIRRREIIRQLRRGERTSEYMEMTARNWRDYGLYVPSARAERPAEETPAEEAPRRRVVSFETSTSR